MCNVSDLFGACLFMMTELVDSLHELVMRSVSNNWLMILLTEWLVAIRIAVEQKRHMKIANRTKHSWPPLHWRAWGFDGVRNTRP